VSLELPRETTADMVVVVVKFVLSPIFSLIALGFLMVQPNLKGILLFALTVLVILIDVYLFYFIYLFLYSISSIYWIKRYPPFSIYFNYSGCLFNCFFFKKNSFLF